MRDLALAKLKTVEKQKADVERVRDELRCALATVYTPTWFSCSRMFTHAALSVPDASICPHYAGAGLCPDNILPGCLPCRTGPARIAT